MNSGKIVAGGRDGWAGGRTSKVLQEVLADLKMVFAIVFLLPTLHNLTPSNQKHKENPQTDISTIVWPQNMNRRILLPLAMYLFG